MSLFALFATAVLVVAFETATHFNGPAIDGPFQLYNALRRIAGHFRPGVDFQYFHGLGIPYLHYLPFLMFGAGIPGSEMARQMVTAFAYPLVFLVAFRIFTGSWRHAFCLSAVAMALSFAMKLSAGIFALNGMIGLRSALPTLIPAVALVSRTPRVRVIAVGAALGLSLFVSTEQGLAAVAAYLVVSAAAIVRRGDHRAQLVESGATLGIAVALLLLCLLSIGGFAGMRGALRYNFRLVPMDQYWFFGAPPNTFIPSWSALPGMLIGAPLIGAALLFVSIALVAYLRRLWRAAAGAPSHRAFAFALLPAYGLVSCASLLGVFTPVYVQPCWRILMIIGLLDWTTIATRVDARGNHAGWLSVPRGVAAVSLALAAVTLISVSLVTTALKTIPHAIDHLTGREKFGFAGIWPQSLTVAQQTIDAHRSPTGQLPTLWSTYAGLIEARNGMFHPTHDYIIHALGPDYRRQYVELLKSEKPALVQTVLATVTQYEPWLENTSWDFYAEVLDWYTVTSTTLWSVFWERRATPAPAPAVIGTLTPSVGEALRIPPIPDSLQSPVTLLEIDIEYETHNPLHILPVVGALPRYLVGVEGAVRSLPITLDPYVRHQRFPLLVDPKAAVTLHFQTFSLLPGASYTPHRVTVAVRRVDPRNQPWLDALTR